MRPPLVPFLPTAPLLVALFPWLFTYQHVGQSNWTRWKRGLAASRGGREGRVPRGTGGTGGAGELGLEEEDLSHAFDDLGVHHCMRGPGTDEPHGGPGSWRNDRNQGSRGNQTSRGDEGSRQAHGSMGGDEEEGEGEGEEEEWVGTEVDEASDREVGELLRVADPWATSGRERRKLVAVWVGEVRATAAAAIEAEVDKYARYGPCWCWCEGRWCGVKGGAGGVKGGAGGVKGGAGGECRLRSGRPVMMKLGDRVGRTMFLVCAWLVTVRFLLACDLLPCVIEHAGRKVRERSELQQVEDLQVPRRAQVVGMTTSGVAKMQRLITALGPRVIIVEEAAEVLEAHILTSLTPQTQHVILIGDHKQLRPKVEVYELSKDSHKGFDLDVSLFERLALSRQIPVYTLATQRRMRPEIADLVRYTIYPDLRDHPFVQGYPDVRGMAVNLHFWDHDSPESGRDDPDGGKSKSNAGEAAMVVALATYLLQQGYAGGEITILTPYVGQLLKLRQALSQVVDVRLGEGDAEEVEKVEDKAGTGGGGAGGREADGEAAGAEVGKGKGLGLELAAPKATMANLKDAVRLATVDNFQGEESTVIIISLVRHKPDGDIGFLKSPNRTNVLLSRAKHGMYIIGACGMWVAGNASSMCACTSKASLWPQIMGMLDSRARVQRFIPLRCASHPDTVTHIQGTGEFKEKASEGGCSQMCSFRLTPCGHTCPRRCHADDRAHATTFCAKECNRIRPLDECPHQHTCPKQCGENCGPCMVTIREVTLPKTVEVTMPLCGHRQQVMCGEAATTLTSPKRCTARCGTLLSDSCGHACRSLCGQCIVAPDANTDHGLGLQQHQQRLERKHKECTQPCKRDLPCGHLCPDPCHLGKPCKPCTKRCLVTCQHSSCPQPCHRTCSACAEPCGWSCRHQGRCSLPCGAPCNRLPCDQRCDKRLSCGHQCPSLCGEKCPSQAFCTVEGCGSKKKREMRVDLITWETLGEIDPNDSPLLVLPCKHPFTVDSLDGYLGLSQVYQESKGASGGCSAVGGGTDASAGKWVAVRPFGDANLAALKSCPDCRQPITGLRRYGRMVNRALLDESERKFALSCMADQQQLQHKLSTLSQALSACPEAAPSRQLEELSQAATVLVAEASKVRRTALDPPTQQAYQASVAALQRKHLRLGSLSFRAARLPADSPARSHVSAWEEECQLLYVPQPDPWPLCEALMLLGKAYQLLMTANFLHLRCLLRELRDVAGRTDKNSTVRATSLAQRVGDCREVVRNALGDAERHVGEAVEWAGRRKAPT
ncbi:unnamed protein product [Closterium sp. Naga37s-1]|nr:unnamed protein product [Closterium sp. Naga37s-1]